jgi:hypothetical protein
MLAAEVDWPDDLQEILFNKGASGELVDDWKKAECRELKQSKKSLAHQRSHRGSDSQRAGAPTTRAMALHIMQELSVRRGLDFQIWCEAVNVFDIFALRSERSKALEPAQLVITCAAIVRLLEKSRSGLSMRLPWPAESVPLIMSSLTEQFFGVVPLGDVALDAEILYRREREVLKALNMRINACPSVHDWLTTIAVRFGVLTRGMMSPRLAWAWSYCINEATLLLSTTSISEELSPQRIAIGLFTLGLICTRIFPHQAFKPPDVTEEEWAGRMNQPPLRSSPACFVAIPSSFSKEPLEILQAATRCRLEEIQVHVDVVTASIADALQLAQEEMN